jgi:hypothetical protein
MTTVVNIRFEPYDIYIGRAGKGQDGYFGNPHPVGYCDICKVNHMRGEAVEAFKKDFLIRIESDTEFRERVLTLRGKRLGCFCKQPNYYFACHGDVYKEWLDNNPNL